MRDFLRINHLVRQAEYHGITLYNENGKALKYYECKIIEPEEPLGGTLDFSQASIQQSFKMGVKRAREVLGR
jgi:hypothetical protein